MGSTFFEQLVGQSEWNAFGTLWLPIGFKVVLSILCGGLIGLERELKQKPAGLRTNILICLGSCLFTMLSVLMASSANGVGEHGDPTRVAAQIVSGIGFLGGGIILQSGGAVLGLTSAATVWVVAAIGMGIGLGFPITSSIFTATVFFCLYFLSKIDNRLLGKLHCYETWIHLKDMDSKSRAEIMDIYQKGPIELSRLSVDEKDGRYQIVARYYSSETRHLRIQASLWSVPQVDRIDVRVS
jgi:uncharacterized membrane protein YhiD involved in acid resistance